ncbi:hypothetical protein COBT_002349, partial [Conglomerata obtusa]
MKKDSKVISNLTFYSKNMTNTMIPLGTSVFHRLLDLDITGKIALNIAVALILILYQFNDEKIQKKHYTYYIALFTIVSFMYLYIMYIIISELAFQWFVREVISEFFNIISLGALIFGFMVCLSLRNEIKLTIFKNIETIFAIRLLIASFFALNLGNELVVKFLDIGLYLPYLVTLIDMLSAPSRDFKST